MGNRLLQRRFLGPDMPEPLGEALMAAACVIEYRCSYCLLPVAQPTDEYCSGSCKELSEEYEEQHVVYTTKEQP